MNRNILVNKNELNTRAKILLSAKEEFFEKGFMGASVRTIAENAGLTTGALYNLFENKDSIFEALTSNAFNEFMSLVTHNISPEDSSYSMKTSDLSLIVDISRVRFMKMVEFFFDNWDAMKLIICCAKGSSYENVFDKIIEVIEKETIHWLKYDGVTISKRCRFFIHVMVSSHLENLKEIFYHDLTKKEAIDYVIDFNTYHCAGWKQYWLEQG